MGRRRADVGAAEVDHAGAVGDGGRAVEHLGLGAGRLQIADPFDADGVGDQVSAGVGEVAQPHRQSTGRDIVNRAQFLPRGAPFDQARRREPLVDGRRTEGCCSGEDGVVRVGRAVAVGIPGGPDLVLARGQGGERPRCRLRAGAGLLEVHVGLVTDAGIGLPARGGGEAGVAVVQHARLGCDA